MATWDNVVFILTINESNLKLNYSALVKGGETMDSLIAFLK